MTIEKKDYKYDKDGKYTTKNNGHTKRPGRSANVVFGTSKLG